jgi:hypothetical protein
LKIQDQQSPYFDENYYQTKINPTNLFLENQTERKKIECCSDLSIREGTFSDDIITTGISLRDDDAYTN